jgi:hypothetical protein
MKKSLLIICTVFFVSLASYSQPAVQRTDVLDDGFTWFEAVNGETLGPNNIPVSTG